MGFINHFLKISRNFIFIVKFIFILSNMYDMIYFCVMPARPDLSGDLKTLVHAQFLRTVLSDHAKFYHL